jgi:nucleotide-binding universal stress UspA family protein
LLRCPRPILAVPGTPSPLTHALLAYDGSPKAQEALYVAAYFASRWELPLTVISTLETGRVTGDAQAEAQQYLEERSVAATYVQETGSPEVAMLRVAEARGCDLILMGGYGHGAVVEAVVGSAVDYVLRESPWPILICR